MTTPKKLTKFEIKIISNKDTKVLSFDNCQTNIIGDYLVVETGINPVKGRLFKLDTIIEYNKHTQ